MARIFIRGSESKASRGTKSGGGSGKSERSNPHVVFWKGVEDTILDTTGPSGGGGGKEDGQFCLQHCCRGLLLGLEQTTLFGEGLLAHQGHKLLERK